MLARSGTKAFSYVLLDRTEELSNGLKVQRMFVIVFVTQ